MADILCISDIDNVVVALKNYKKGETFIFKGKEIKVIDDIPVAHKIAIKNINKFENVLKYGAPIGHALENIMTGSHVHTHNIKTNLNDKLQYHYNQRCSKLNIQPDGKKFKGFLRSNGDAGIRNEIWIIPTVGCVNAVAQNIKNKFLENFSELNGVDGIQVFEHNYGCSQLGEDHENTRTILADIVRHPNAGGVLVVGLGCENNQIEQFKELVGKVDSSRIKFMVAQDYENEIDKGCNLLTEIFNTAKNDKREDIEISKLKIGLECGGSDGFSGITANPLLGYFSDYIIANGGISVLTEVPEMFGAETILMDRCIDESVFEKTVSLINEFKDYFKKANQPVYENPSPGNKNGGITTLEDKSLGCTQKGGISPVTNVFNYGEIITGKGLMLLCSPGNDMVATTALAASGCQIVLFTTGRGTPFGGFVPTIKIATNSALANKKQNWIDFDAGKLISEGISMETLLKEFSSLVFEVCEGKNTKNETNNFRNMTIWKNGVTL